MASALKSVGAPNGNADPSRSVAKQVTLIWLLMTTLAAAWSLSIPVDGAPDEHRHLIYAYALQTGQVSSVSTTYSVPERVGFNRSACYAFKSEVSAACDTMATEVTGDQEISVSTSANNYPRLYYRVAGWPLGIFEGDIAIYLSRLAGAALCSALISMALVAAIEARRRWLTLGALLGMTPTLLFMVGAFNPHGLEMSGCLAFSVSLILLASERAPNLLTRVTLVASIAPMVLSRPWGFVWPVLLAAPVVLAFGRSSFGFTNLSRRMRASAGALLVLSMSYALWWQLTLAGRDTGSGVVGPRADQFGSWWSTTLQVVGSLQTFPGDWFGNFGWLDSPISNGTLMLWFGLTGALVVNAIMFGRRPVVAGAGGAMALAALTSVALDMYYRETLQITFAQGRYVLPLVILALCLVADSLHGTQVLNKGMPGLIACGWVLGMSLGLFEALRRYTVGVNMRSTYGSWAPPLPASVLILLGGVTALSLAWVIARDEAR